MPKAFAYYEVRPCVAFGEGEGREVRSFRGRPEYSPARGADIFTHESAREEAEAFCETEGHLAPSPVFWTLYGRTGTGEAQAIGDFTTFEAAYETMLAILAPLVDARNKLESCLAGDWLDGEHLRAILSDMEDICNQSSNEERQ